LHGPQSRRPLAPQALVQGIADLARQALSSDPAAAEQLKRYEAAVVALEQARAKEKELEKMMAVGLLAGGQAPAPPAQHPACQPPRHK
jgi:hypothetical protein